MIDKGTKPEGGAHASGVSKHQWSTLNKLQVGRYAEYLAKMEFALYGFDVYTAEVDYHGIDFVIRKDVDRFYDIQVKSLRGPGYIFFRKSNFTPRETLFVVVIILIDNQPPQLFLVPSVVWHQPNDLFKSRDYEGKKSPPEWGLELSSKKLPMLDQYAFGETIGTM